MKCKSAVDLPIICDRKYIDKTYQVKAAMTSLAQSIKSRIERFEPGTVCIPSDFYDLGSAQNVYNVLSRLVRQGVIRHVVRGVYATPCYSELLNMEVLPNPEDVVEAIGRSNGWIVAPSENVALNRLGLDTQVPAHYVFVSSGPYKTYRYGNFEIVLKHRACRDLIGRSQLTIMIIQALKAIGRSNVSDHHLEILASWMSAEEVERFYRETHDATSWIFELAKRLKEVFHEQRRENARA